MNRRKALKTAGIIGLAGAVSYSGYEFFRYPNNDSAYIDKKMPIMAELVECIIPKTDTPGAKEALVHYFVINIIQNCSSVREQKRFWKGVEELESYSIRNFDQRFIHCSEEEKNRILLYFEEHGRLFPGIMGKIERKVFGEPFFYLLKKYTINGYCISQPGATQNFRYDYIPVTFEPCIPYKPGESSWATK